MVDFAEENKHHAAELAKAAAVAIDYRVADSIVADTFGLGRCDAIVMEFGVSRRPMDCPRKIVVVSDVLQNSSQKAQSLLASPLALCGGSSSTRCSSLAV